MTKISPDQPSSATTLPADAGAVTDAAAHRLGAGTTTIKDSVIGKVVGLAVHELPGVHAVGSTPLRAIGAIVGTISRAEVNPGITIELGEDGVTVQIVLVAAYPVPLTALAENVRASVTQAIEGLVGMRVSAVNVTITDIYVAEESADTDVV
ncbi:Asp23/Gls24 family envelope stress response protein [Cryobacterium sp.]|jgi:uncharacterized alkaline shock family protein YloU|uniref:Asp23/Gls24 family envelope stress response protein n=1 Tax=Cryobacterium sp. TaxID=1926290 RepID=UPI00260E55BC|nr:Asp23/Gls24 family envelope stress response protein [Cryobacterium sp.]MCU1446435.1 alkaline-shock protein [Cryobacterium sp.]